MPILRLRHFLKPGIVTAASVWLLTGCAHRQVEIDALHLAGCAQPPDGASPWHVTRLYNCDTRSFYIPYQLWTGAAWDGDRSKPCMHEADTRFTVNDGSPTTIKGPIEWTHPKTGKVYQTWHRNKVDGSKLQIFTCNENGIGRLYDSRRPRTYAPGRCKFPAGPGWKMFSRRSCRNTSIELLGVTLNASNELAELKFQWWFGSTLDHVYRYAPGKSMFWAQRQFRPGN